MFYCSILGAFLGWIGELECVVVHDTYLAFLLFFLFDIWGPNRCNCRCICTVLHRMHGTDDTK